MEGAPGGRCPAGAAGRAGMGWRRRPPWAAASRGAVVGVVPGTLGAPTSGGGGCQAGGGLRPTGARPPPLRGAGFPRGSGVSSGRCWRRVSPRLRRRVTTSSPPRPGAAVGGSWQSGSRCARCPRPSAQAESPARASHLSPSPGRGSTFPSSPGGPVKGDRTRLLFGHHPPLRCPPAQDRKEVTEGPGLSRDRRRGPRGSPSLEPGWLSSCQCQKS